MNKPLVLFGVDVRRSRGRTDVSFILLRLSFPEISWQLAVNWKRMLSAG